MSEQESPIDWEEVFKLEESNHGQEAVAEARKVLAENPTWTVWQVMQTARLRLQEDALQNFAAMNVQPFDSRRD